MNCPKCNEVLEKGMRFCTKCGANIEEATKELEEQKRKEAEQEQRIKEEAEEIARLEAEVKAQREAEEKRIEEERKQEELKRQEEEAKAREEAARRLEEERREEELKREEERLEEEKRILEEEKKKLEEEKLQAIREAEELKRIKEENEEKERQAAENAKKALEVSKEQKEEFIAKAETKVVETVKENVASEAEFKPAKKQKVKKKRKGIIRRLFDRLILIIVLIAVFVGGIYYLNRNGYLPEVVSNEINGLLEQLKDVKSGMNQEYKNNEKKESSEAKKDKETTENKNEVKITWAIENTIDAENIINLNSDVSTIIQNGKYGIIDNETGKILLDVKYDGVYVLNGTIIVVDGEKLYNVDSKYQIANEADDITVDEYIYEYIYVKADDNIYFYDSIDGAIKDIEKVESHPAEVVVYEEVTIDEDDISIVNGERNVQYEAINHTGNFGVYSVKERAKVTDAKYQNIFDYNEEYAATKNGDVAGFLKKTGEEIAFEYEETRNVYNGLAFAKKDGKWGIIKIEK